MKILPLAVLMTIAAPNVILANEEGTTSAISHAASYGGSIVKDNAGAVMNSLQDAGHAVATPTKKAARSFWGHVLDVGNGIEKSRAISNGDGVALNASVYSLALRQAERDNTALNQLQKEREERQYALKRTQKEVERLQELAKDYKTDAVNFQSNISTTLVGMAEQAQKLKGWDEAHQKKMDEFVKQHKELGKLTGTDGASRVGEHTLLSMKEMWTDIEDFVRKSPDKAKAAGLDVRFKSMSSLLSGAIERIGKKEEQLLSAVGKINELSKVNEAKLLDDEESLKRQMILGTLNNSVNNLIMSADFQKVRSQLAFSHFKDIEESMKEKGVKAGDVKEIYKKNAQNLAAQYNETPFGLYVNGQIAKAMGTVCDLVANQCKDGSNAALFDFLDDSSRFQLKLTPVEGGGPQNTDKDVTR